MGILNLTPDSFSDGGRYSDPDHAVARAVRMAEEGAGIIDLGGESTRPGARPVSAQEEWRRLEPVLLGLQGKVSVPVSIDTTKPEVAEKALRAGAHIINDVSGLSEGPALAEIVRDFGAGLILMHRRGTPETMQSLAHYEDVVAEVLEELRASMDRAKAAGTACEQIVVDPGLGFAKTPGQNVEILSQLEKFHALGCPVLLGPSRKSFIGKITGREIGEREYGTAAVVTHAVLKGIQMLRVHEIGAMRDVVRMAEAIEGVSHVRSL